MNKKDLLEKQIIEYEKKIENNKLKRVILCIGLIAIVIFIVFFKTQEISSVVGVLQAIIASVFGAGLYFYINMYIYIPLFSMANEENMTLEKMKKEYSELKLEGENKKV